MPPVVVKRLDFLRVFGIVCPLKYTALQLSILSKELLTFASRVKRRFLERVLHSTKNVSQTFLVPSSNG